jgi:hypothetical protein
LESWYAAQTPKAASTPSAVMSSGRIQRGSRRAAQGRKRRSKGANRKFGSRSASTPCLRCSPSLIGRILVTKSVISANCSVRARL